MQNLFPQRLSSILERDIPFTQRRQAVFNEEAGEIVDFSNLYAERGFFFDERLEIGCTIDAGKAGEAFKFSPGDFVIGIRGRVMQAPDRFPFIICGFMQFKNGLRRGSVKSCPAIL